MKIYVINDGDIFDGTLEQFKDCFFSNADDDSIKDWCDSQGMTLMILNLDESEMTINDKNLPQTSVMTIKAALELFDIYLKDRTERTQQEMSMNRCFRKNIAWINQLMVKL